MKMRKQLLIIIGVLVVVLGVGLGVWTFLGQDSQSDNGNIVLSIKGESKLYLSVGDDRPVWKDHFEIVEDSKTVEVKDDYVETDLDMTKEGNYKATLKYKEKSVTLSINVAVKSNSNNSGNGNGSTNSGTNSGSTSSGSNNNTGNNSGSNSSNNNGNNSGNNNKDDVSNEPQTPVKPEGEGVRLGTVSKLSYPVGTAIELNKLCSLYDGDTEIKDAQLKFDTKLNIYMAGTYTVKVSTIYKFKDYNFSFDVKITPLTEQVVSDETVERWNTTVNNTYYASIANLDIGVPSDDFYYFKKVTTNGINYIRYNVVPSYQIIFVYDKNDPDSVITLQYLKELVEERYRNKEYCTTIQVLDVHKHLEKLKKYRDTENKQLAVDALTSFIEGRYVESSRDTDWKNKLTEGCVRFASTFFYVGDDGKYVNLEKANNTYSYENYKNYILKFSELYDKNFK